MTFRRCLLAGLLATLFGTAANAQLPFLSNKSINQIQSAYAKVEKKDCKSALTDLKGIWTRPDFVKLPDEVRSSAYALAAACAADEKDGKSAYEFALAGTKISGTFDSLWFMRIDFEVNAHRYDDAVTTIAAMSTSNPDALNSVNINFLGQLDRAIAKSSNKLTRRRLLETLSAQGFQPNEVLTTGDLFKREYAGLLAENGERESAAQVVGRITEPSQLVLVSLDPVLRSALPADFDARSAVESDLAHARDVSASHATSLSAVLHIARDMHALGQPQASLATLLAADPTKTGNSFTDLTEQANWWWNDVAMTYRILGRYDDMVTSYRAAINSQKSGKLNVSQTINLGYGQLRFGRPKEALATLAAFDNGKYDASPFGEMQLRVTRGCALALDGQAEAAKADLDYARVHEKDAPTSLGDLLGCMGDMDGAAAVWIRGLGDAETRATILRDLCDYDPPAVTDPQGPFETALVQLKARPDVRAAIERAGGVRRIHIQG